MATQRVDYHRYMASREWALKKKAIRERARGECERCHRPMSQVHHLSYQHLGNEPLEDLQGVCKWCHEYLSAVRDIDPVDVNDWEFFKGYTYEEDEDGSDWHPVSQENIPYVERWGSQWQHEMRSKYGTNWGNVLNNDMILIGAVMLLEDQDDSDRFARLPAIF